MGALRGPDRGRAAHQSEAFVEEERRALPTRIFDQEYRCQFVEIEDAVFSLEDVDSAITDEVQPLFGEAS